MQFPIFLEPPNQWVLDENTSELDTLWQIMLIKYENWVKYILGRGLWVGPTLKTPAEAVLTVDRGNST